MDWPYSQALVYAGIRQIAISNATAISNDKLEEIISRLEAQGP